MDSRLGTQLKQLVDALNNASIAFALIGGLALAAHKVIRAVHKTLKTFVHSCVKIGII
jgi:hypothetical protein